MKDHFNQSLARRAISPQSSGDDTAIVSQIIDRSGFETLEFLIATGAIGDANVTFAVTMDEGDASNLSDAAAVATADKIGTLAGAGFTFAHTDAIRRIGYKGTKRYVRLTITPTGNSATLPAYIAAIAMLSNPRTAPQSSQS